MASLKKIMNADEDSPDPDSHKRAQHSASSSSRPSVSTPSAPAQPPASASGPSYTTSFNYALPSSSSSAYTFNPQSTTTTTTPSRSPYPFAPDAPAPSSSYSPSSAPAGGRRVSSTSTESMDSHYQPQGYARDYDDAGPSQSHGSGQGSSSGGLRMTPVTGRPSKAMKGRPVHICELCQPPKAFTRAEHLRRHQPSHYPPTLACNIAGCDRVFWRQDLLDRHRQKHKQDSNLPDDGTRHLSHDTDESPPYTGPGPTSYDNTPPGPPLQGGQQQQTHPPAWPHAQGNMQGSTSAPESSQPPWTGFPATDNWPLSPEGIPRTHDLSMPVYSSMPPYGTSIPDANFPGYGDLFTHNPPHTTVRSLPLTLAVGPSSESLVTFQSAAPARPVEGTLSCGGSRGGRPDPLAVAALMMPTSLSEEARKTIPTYINVYWNKVHPTCPLIHKPTFDDEETSRSRNSGICEQKELRKCAMAAIATQFLEDKVHRVHGDELCGHAWYQSIEHKHSEAWTLETMQTLLLCEYYARFRGKRRTSHLASSQFRLLYQNIASYSDIFAPVSTSGNGAQSWKKWIQIESRRRILAACFLLDTHSSLYFKQPPVSIQGLDYASVLSLHIPLSMGMNDLWNAANFRSWNSLAKHSPKLTYLSTALVPSLTAEDIAQAPPFDAAIMLAGCLLQLRAMQNSGRMSSRNPNVSISPEVAHLRSLFRGSGTANAYLAFHHAPLHEVLSVSGDSWLFNEKILQPRIWNEHRKTLASWSTSNDATVAVHFAVRGIASFLNLSHETAEDVHAALVAGRLVTWTDISDYWGLYVCTLICWAWGQGVTTSRADRKTDASKRNAISWILAVGASDVQDLSEWTGRGQTRALVCLVQDILERGCPSGRNRMFCDTVSVLKKLGDRAAVGF